MSNDHAGIGRAGNGWAVSSGLVAGTLVEGPDGWMPVETLRIGSAVHSLDGGMARVCGLDRQWILPGTDVRVLRVPGGALDNCSDLVLLPDQLVVIDTLGDSQLDDAGLVLVPAVVLDGLIGTARTRIVAPLEVVTPRFADDEVIFANSGSLLHCSSITRRAGDPASAFFTQLDADDARGLLERLFCTPAVDDQRPLHRAA